MLTAAADRLHPWQGVLDLGPLPQRKSASPIWRTGPTPAAARMGRLLFGGEGEAAKERQVDNWGRVVRTSPLTLWSALEQAWTALGFDAVADDAFRAVVLAWIIEPVSKADTVRVLDEVVWPGPSLRTIFRALGRCQERDYRGQLALACLRKPTRSDRCR